ncbi:deleted in autism-related protein 1 [Myotis lucifugus]|uniref:deleted in autism-related protein 1 n=1 Tax=Myotis lucifugus TaxID=59463 RepID=UPI000CCBFD78|nr:deleted in autism-related protein 1 [Myotis lucifugus]
MEPRLGPGAAALRLGWPAQLLWVSALSSAVSSPAPPSPRTSYSLGRTVVGLDKCNACIGTSICKKFFKEEIRFDSWLATHVDLPLGYLPSYPANYSDDSKTWRPVEISRLVSKHQHDVSDRRICASAAAPKTCSIERVLRKTGRFQKWLQAKRLTPDLVQVVGCVTVHASLLGSQAAARAAENKDIFSCLVTGCQAELPSCDSIPEKQSLVLVCRQVLPQLLQGKFPSPVQEQIDVLLAKCGEGARPDPEVLEAASQLKSILRPLRTCDPRFAYRYPDCRYNDKF